MATKSDNVKPFPENSKRKDETRLQIILSKRSMDKLDNLKDKLDTASRAEVIRLSLGILDYIVDKSLDGNRILVENRDGSMQEIAIVEPLIK